MAARLAALQRLCADVDVVAERLRPLVSADAPKDAVDREAAGALTHALAVAAGVPVVARATERAYVHRAVRSTGWPLTKWLRRLRPDPLGRLRLGGSIASASSTESEPTSSTESEPAPVGATSMPPAAPAAKAAVGLALRAVADRTGAALPEPWPVGGARRGAVPQRRPDRRARRGDLAYGPWLSRRPLWWRFVGALQWLSTLVALVGLGWLGVRLALFAFGLPDLIPAPTVGQVQAPSVLFFGGLLAGLLMSILVRPVIHIAARRKAVRAMTRMRNAVEQVATDMVLGPIRTVLRAYADARAALRGATRQ